ncbi:MAG: patatin-like phospholipase family protein [Rhodocyclaceae bacterium]
MSVFKCLGSLALALLATCVAAQTPAEPPRPRIGLVLGGGGARGLAHLGVLEELRRLNVPIDCIAGTSAGALIGGIYASGMDVPELIERVEGADWDQLLSGTPDRRDMPFTRKTDDFKNYASFTLGLDAAGLHIPRSVIGSQAIDRFLHQLTRDVNVPSYAQLPIPFQAVSTDLVTGQMKTFTGGDLAVALRASMAVPGIFDAVRVDEQFLVDGMFVRNLPIENVKEQCQAEVVIAVDVGRPMLKAEQIHSLVDVIDQAMQIATGQNVREQRALLGPQDIIIEPRLDEYSTASFRDVRAIVQRGREAVAPLAERLRVLAISEADYARWRIAIDQAVPGAGQHFDRIEVAKTRFVPEENIGQVLAGKDAPSNQRALQDRLDSLYDTGDFDRLDYFVRDENGQRIATVTPFERAVGPNYLRLGLDVQFDSFQTANIALLGNYQMTWLNSWGAQWRTSARLGHDSAITTELMQPLARSPVFVAANASIGSRSLPLFLQDGSQLLEVGFWDRAAGGDLGYSFGRYGEFRLGGFVQNRRAAVRSGLPWAEPTNNTSHGVRAGFVIDQMDNPRFPRNGYFIRADYLNGRQKSRDNEYGRYRQAETDIDVAHTFTRTTVRATVRGRSVASEVMENDGTLSRDSSDQVYTLGGFLQLSGLQTDRLAGEKIVLGRIMAYQQVAPLLPTFGSGTYVGASLELGKVWKQILFDDQSTAWIPAASAYVGVDTLFGPLYLALGWANYHGGSVGAYLYLGYIK